MWITLFTFMILIDEKYSFYIYKICREPKRGLKMRKSESAINRNAKSLSKGI